jgi:hypothetical protein
MRKGEEEERREGSGAGHIPKFPFPRLYNTNKARDFPKLQSHRVKRLIAVIEHNHPKAIADELTLFIFIHLSGDIPRN